jgi:Ca2+-binding EF-hand superfamily protein
MKVAMKYVTADFIEDLKLVFQDIDTEHTGFVTADALSTAMGKVGLHQAAFEIERIVESITHSAEGKVNYSEFLLATINLKT